MSRIIHDNDFMQFVMTPPRMSKEEYEIYEPRTSQIRIVRGEESGGGSGSGSGSYGLGQLPTVGPVQGMFGSGQDWVMPIVIIVVSAMALMTLYSVLNKR